MMDKFWNRCEAFILTVLGVIILWFATAGDYGLLMNENFRWLTITGGALLLIMGVVFFGSAQKKSALNTCIFGVMLLVVFYGKPYLPDDNLMVQPETSLQTGLWDIIDQSRFPRIGLQELCTFESEKTFRSGGAFTTVGVARRLEGLDSHGSFALMTSFMYCCLADMYGVGLRVPSRDWKTIEDGQWIMISGTLAQETKDIILPNFRFGRAMLSSIRKDYYLKPDKIMIFDRASQMPVLTKKLSLNKGVCSRYSNALKKTGLWQTLEKEGPFTIFVPVDQALDNIEGTLQDKAVDDLSPTELKQLVSSHIVKGKFYEKDLQGQVPLKTLNGLNLITESINGKVRINGSRLLHADSEAKNGVIHFIYPVISPNILEKFSNDPFKR